MKENPANTPIIEEHFRFPRFAHQAVLLGSIFEIDLPRNVGTPTKTILHTYTKLGVVIAKPNFTGSKSAFEPSLTRFQWSTVCIIFSGSHQERREVILIDGASQNGLIHFLLTNRPKITQADGDLWTKAVRPTQSTSHFGQIRVEVNLPHIILKPGCKKLLQYICNGN